MRRSILRCESLRGSLARDRGGAARCRHVAGRVSGEGEALAGRQRVVELTRLGPRRTATAQSQGSPELASMDRPAQLACPIRILDSIEIHSLGSLRADL